MVSRKILDERGVFTRDMDDVQQQFMEIHETLLLVCEQEKTKGDVPAVLEAVARAILRLASDVDDIDEVLRERGAIITAEDAMRRKREADAKPAAKVVSLHACKVARRSRKMVRK